MFAIINNNAIEQLIAPGTAFTHNGIQYPANWCNLSTPAEKAEIGMVDVIYGQRPNETFYWVSEDAPAIVGGQVQINYTATPKDLFTCQANQVDATNQAAYAILLPSDWMVVKSIETRGIVPSDWNTWRQAIRDQAAAQVAAITVCTTIEELAALPAIEWGPSPDQVVPA